jgi:APA family basic amino acid/polyamine antiporter
MATTARSPKTLERGQLGLFGVIMPGLAQVAPAFNLFFTTGVMVGLAGASAPLIFLISMVGMAATASSLAQFAGVYPSAGSFITYITRVSGIIYVLGSYALVTAFGVGHVGALAADPNPFRTAAKAFIPFLAPVITWLFLSSVTSSYVAANTQTARVIFAGARGGLWSRALAGVSPRFRTPAAAAVAFVAPSIVIGVVSTAFTSPATASGFLGTYGILGLIIMYLMANAALVVEWARFRRRGIRKNPWLWLVTPVIGVAVLAIPVWGDLRPGQASPYNTLPWLTLGLLAVGVAYPLILGAWRPRVLEQAPALLEGEESLATDPLPIGG